MANIVGQLKAGDIIGFSGNCGTSDLINVATYGIPHWGISHVGVMAYDFLGRLLLFESTTLDGLPCVITGKKFNGTQAHFLHDVLDRYDGKAWRYPLYRRLYEHENRRLAKFLLDTIHTPYDAIGAFRSGGVGFSWLESRLHGSNLHSIFCSEWVAAAYSTVGFSPTGNVSKWNPNRLCRHLLYNEVLCDPERLK